MAAEVHRFISEIYSVSAPSVKTYKYWFRQLKSDDFEKMLRLTKKVQGYRITGIVGCKLNSNA